MFARNPLGAAAILVTLAHPATAQEPLTTYKSLSPERRLIWHEHRMAIADPAGTRSPSRSSIALGLPR